MNIGILAPTDFQGFSFGGTLAFIEGFLLSTEQDTSVRFTLIGLAPEAAESREMLIAGRACTFIPIGRAVPNSRLPLRLLFLRSLLGAGPKLEAIGLDVVYAHSAESAAAASFVLPKVPVVMHCHGTENTIRRSRYWFGRQGLTRWAYEHGVMRVGLRRSRSVLVTADDLQYTQFLARHNLSRLGKCLRVPALVDTDLFYPIDASTRGEPGTIVSISRLERPKGVDLVLRAFSELRVCGVHCKLVIIGDGGYRRELERISSGLGLDGAVEFTGYLRRDEVARVLRGASAYASGSEQEGFSIALLEALASGLPAVATDVGGVHEVVRNGETGYILTSRRPEEMAARLKDALEFGDRERAECRNVAMLHSAQNIGRAVLDAILRAAEPDLQVLPAGRN